MSKEDAFILEGNVETVIVGAFTVENGVERAVFTIEGGVERALLPLGAM